MRLGVIGANGKMGKKIVLLANQDPFFQTTLPLITQNESENTPKLDVIIDFSTKEALPYNLKLAQKINCPLVIGTTGLEKNEKELLTQAAKNIPIFWAPNFSLGMAATVYVSKLLSSLLQDFTPLIEEIHHVHKKDTPSGSALALKDTLIKENPSKPPIIKSHREGEVIGKHTVSFSSDKESITISHEAFSRDVFAKGALLAARFLLKQKPGLYTMEHLLEKALLQLH